MEEMKVLSKMLILLVVNVIVLVVLLEIGGNIFFLAQNGRLFYAPKHLDLEGSRQPNPFMSGDLHGAIHPYFGFMYKMNPGGEKNLHDIKFNRHGFIFNAKYDYPGCCEYPSVRHPDEIFVGIFGGSVAGALAYRMQETPAFVDAIRAIPRFAGKQIRVVSFALGGYKQPQQLMVLAYYLSLGQPLDVVVNVDGFNEILSDAGLLNSGMDIGYPDASLWMELVRFLEGEAQHAHTAEDFLANYHSIMRRRWARSAADCRFVTCYSFARLLQYWHQMNSTILPSPEQATPASPFCFQINPAAINIEGAAEDVGGVRVVTGQAAYDVAADHWVRSSYVMQQLARGQNIVYHHVLQPSQWFRRSVPYVPRGPDETTAYLKKIVPIGYSALLAKVPRMTELGVNFLDTSGLLDNEPSSVYSDDGHFAPRGYDLLAGAIIKALAAPDIH
jgi:hypothetical protein